MNNFGETRHLKKEILIRIIKAFLSDDFEEQTRLIPYYMRPKGVEVPYRCCVYKERAIIKDRTIAGLGFPIEEDDETVALSTYAKKAMEREEISRIENLTLSWLNDNEDKWTRDENGYLVFTVPEDQVEEDVKIGFNLRNEGIRRTEEALKLLKKMDQ
jgi:CRISPR/Cas system CMR-associated protein Cmr3 (group 5 of RAMP superfamily)